jgi:hypothetical protein
LSGKNLTKIKIRGPFHNWADASFPHGECIQVLKKVWTQATKLRGLDAHAGSVA